MDVYIESLCGDCHRFVANELKYLALHPELLDYLDMDLHIFGKARIADAAKHRFYCQFGEDGCIGNRALNCIYKHSTSFLNAVRVMECMYEVRSSTESDIRLCYAKFDLDPEDALTCFRSDEANVLLLEAGKRTPPLRWVPAFQTDERLRVDMRKIVYVICDSIQGEKPASCYATKHTVGMDTEL